MRDLYQSAYALTRSGVSINPARGHAFRRTLDARCGACGWPSYHPAHILHGRPFPFLGSRVRLLSVPIKWTESRGYPPLKIGMEGTVVLGPTDWEPYDSNLVLGCTFTTGRFGPWASLDIFVAARTLLVVKS